MSFFDKNMGPLREEEQEGYAAGAVRAAGEAVAGLSAESASDQSSAPTVTNTTDTANDARITTSREDVPRVIRRAASAKQPKPTAAPGDIQVTSTVDRIQTQGEQALLAQYTQQEQAFTWGVGAAELKASNASVAALQQWDEMNQKSYEGRTQLINEVFPRWRRANEQLSKDIDDARRLKVNPYNYIQSVGRAGRVASVLSVGIGQLAAGAGNANSVYLRLEAAMARDIAAQKDNIAQAWKGIEAKRQLTQDEIDLLEQQFNFEDRAMAVGYAALAARIGAAKQHAKSETISLNMQMLEERALAQVAYAAGEARAKAATFMMDARVHSVYGAMKKAEKMAMLQTLRQQQVDLEGQYGFDAAQTYADTAQPLTMLDGTEIGPNGPVGAPGAAAPAQAPAAAPAPAAVPAAAAVSKDRRRTNAAGGTSRPKTPTQGEVAAPTPAASTGQPEASTAKSTPAAPEVTPKAQPTARSIADEVGDEGVRKHGSWGRAAEAAAGFEPSGLTLDEMVAKVNDPNNLDYAVAETMQDAAQVAARVKGPNRQDPAFWSRGEGGKPVLNQPAWDMAQRRYKNMKNYPEMFLKNLPNVNLTTGEFEEGRSNVLRAPDGTVLKILSDKKHLLTDSAKRSELENEIEETYKSAEQLADAAEQYRKYGGNSTFMGIRVGPKGIQFTDLDAGATAARADMQRLFLGAGIQAIKSLDPAGRLSNEDVGFGRQLIASIVDGVAPSIEVLSQWYTNHFKKPGSLSDIRAAAGRVFAAATKNYLLSLDTKIGPDVVVSAEGYKAMEDRANRVNDSISTGNEDYEKHSREEEQDEYERRTQSPEGKFLDDVVSPNPFVIPTAGAKYLYRRAGKLYDAVTGEEEEPEKEEK